MRRWRGWTRRWRRSSAGCPDRGRPAVIGKVSRGRRVGWLLAYLYGPGRRNEHVNPHTIAGFDDPDWLDPPARPDGRRDTARLAELLEQPLRVYRRSTGRPVWHCPVRAAPADRRLTDQPETAAPLTERALAGASHAAAVRDRVTARLPPPAVPHGPAADLTRLRAAHTEAAAFYRDHLHSAAGARPRAYLHQPRRRRSTGSRQPVGRRLRPTRLDRAHPAPARARLPRPRTDRRRAGHPQPPRRDHRRVPGPGHLRRARLFGDARDADVAGGFGR
jgi:hypothetical protein